MNTHLNIMVGGEAGQGVQSVGFILAKVFARGGYYVFTDQDYESRVRGGHNFYRIRVQDSEIAAISESVDILIALNKETIDLHQKKLTAKGVIVFDNERIKDVNDNANFFGLPLGKIAEEESGNKLMTNTVALGVVLGLVNYSFEIPERVIREYFGSNETGEDNVKAAHAGYEYTQKNFSRDFDCHLSPTSNTKKILLNGNEAIALGAIAAGCKFISAYPMTPATSIVEYMAAKADEFGTVVIQSEDEIAAINMAIGAIYAGVRSMTATSGGGFCLMVEGLGLAGITETPIVVVNAQRPGPAIGLPTRTEQGDLQFTLHASHGDFPRAVLAPATVEDCFWSTVKAFNLAEKYQLPVTILTDQHLASSYATVNKFDLLNIVIDRGLLYSRDKTGEQEYKRHKITESGISPRAFPGKEGTLVVTDSDEHDEEGHPIEDADIRAQMVQKRMRKVFSLKNDITPPQLYGAKKADTTLIGWGSTYGAIREAADILKKEKVSINMLHFNALWPFLIEKVSDVLANSRYSYVIENNATGQLARLIEMETGKNPSGSILKYDGRPFTPAYIVQEVRKEGC